MSSESKGWKTLDGVERLETLVEPGELNNIDESEKLATLDESGQFKSLETSTQLKTSDEPGDLKTSERSETSNELGDLKTYKDSGRLETPNEPGDLTAYNDSERLKISDKLGDLNAWDESKKLEPLGEPRELTSLDMTEKLEELDESELKRVDESKSFNLKESLLKEAPDNFEIELCLQKMKRMNMKRNIHHQVLFKDLKGFINASMDGNRTANVKLDRMCITDLHKAVICNNYDEVQHILKLSTTCVNDESWFGETALYFASYIGSLPLVLMLLSYGAKLTTEDYAEESELMAAVRTDQTSVVKALVSNGSNVNIMCDDWTPLHVACFRKSANVIRTLVDLGANVNAVGEWSYRPINMIFVEHSDKVQLIHECQDEWLVNRSLESLLTSSDVDVNYSSHCALGNPQVITRALTLLSPTICRLLMNHGASTDILFDYSKKAIHDELVVVFSIYGSKLGFGLADRINRYTACLQLLVYHGIEPATADMKTTARLLLRQLRLVPLSVKYPHLEPTFRMLLDLCTTGRDPANLMSLSRRAVRRYLGHPVALRLDSLDCVSPWLKSYILMTDIGGTELYS